MFVSLFLVTYLCNVHATSKYKCNKQEYLSWPGCYDQGAHLFHKDIDLTWVNDNPSNGKLAMALTPVTSLLLSWPMHGATLKKTNFVSALTNRSNVALEKLKGEAKKGECAVQEIEKPS